MASAAKLVFMLSVVTVAGADKFKFPCGPRDCAVQTKYKYPKLLNILTTESRQAPCESDDFGGWTVIQVVNDCLGVLRGCRGRVLGQKSRSLT